MAYSILIQSNTMATDVASLNTSAVCGSALENGNLVRLDSVSGSTGYSEVFHASAPISGSVNNLWMVCTPEVVTVTAGGVSYKGINPDIRNFINAAGDVVDVFKPMAGDVITLSADAFTGAKSSSTHATAQVDVFDLLWGTTEIPSTLTLKWLATDYISFGSGSSIGGDQRVTAYRMLVLSN